MKEWGVHNKRRREEQIRLIRQGFHKSCQLTPNDYDGDFPNEPSKPVAILSPDVLDAPKWTSPPPPLRHMESSEGIRPWETQKPVSRVPKRRQRSKFLIQMVLASALFLGTTIAIQHRTQVGQVITSGLQQKMNVNTVVQLIDQVIGEHGTVLPTFNGFPSNKKKKSAQPPVNWQVPGKGKILLPFTAERKGLVLRLANDDDIQVARDGWISFVGKKEGLGNTVIIQHDDGSESWYGFLTKTSIQAKAVVKKGDKLGKTEEKQGQHFLYFAIHKQNTWLDPTKVVSFDASN